MRKKKPAPVQRQELASEVLHFPPCICPYDGKPCPRGECTADCEKDNDPTRKPKGIYLHVPAEVSDQAVIMLDKFFEAIVEKFVAAQRKYGYTDEWLRSTEKQLQDALDEHVKKGDPRDVGIFSAFLHHHGWKTVAPPCSDHREFINGRCTLCGGLAD